MITASPDNNKADQLAASDVSRAPLVLLVGVIGFVLCVAGIFLPWATFEFGSTGEFSGGNVRGGSVAAAAALSLAALLFGQKTQTRWFFWLAAAAGLLATLLTVDFWFRELMVLPDTYKGLELDIGLTLPGMALGGLLLTVAAYEAARSASRTALARNNGGVEAT